MLSISYDGIWNIMNNDKPMYGLWITNQGWIRGEKDVIAFSDFSFALEVARIIDAKIRRIDDSWKDLEKLYLEQDARKGKSLWHIFRIYS